MNLPQFQLVRVLCKLFLFFPQVLTILHMSYCQYLDIKLLHPTLALLRTLHLDSSSIQFDLDDDRHPGFRNLVDFRLLHFLLHLLSPRKQAICNFLFYKVCLHCIPMGLSLHFLLPFHYVLEQIDFLELQFVAPGILQLYFVWIRFLHIDNTQFPIVLDVQVFQMLIFFQYFKVYLTNLFHVLTHIRRGCLN